MMTVGYFMIAHSFNVENILKHHNIWSFELYLFQMLMLLIDELKFMTLWMFIPNIKLLKCCLLK